MLQSVGSDPVDAGSLGRWAEGASLNVDDLMEELRARADVARRSHEQLEALLDAVTAVSTNLELSVVLGRIVRSACSLVNARYGALGVLSPDGEHLVEFVTHGLTAQERAAIGDLPRGHGVLGLLIRDPRPRRMADIGSHPDSFGFPPNHPPMRSFLGAPIRIRDEVFGNLYLSERKGDTEFSEADEAMLVALASAAGFAIDNARLYERSQQQRQWEQAISGLTQSLLESEAEDEPLPQVAERVCRLAGADLCLIALHDEGAPSSVRAWHLGPQARGGPADRDRLPVLEGPEWTEVLGSHVELLLLPESQDGSAMRLASELSRAVGLDSVGPTAILPLSAGAADIGHLVVQWSPGRADAASQAMAPLSAFAQQAALGLIAARAQQDRALVTRLSDRDRIARDMHDHVIQRLFATGLSLQAAARLAAHPVVRARLDEAVDSLDLAIKDIRSTILGLHTIADGTDVESRLRGLVDTYAPHIEHGPTLELEGDLTRLDAALEADLVAVVREALSNVARHAHATRVAVRVTVGESVSVLVTDDGIGTGTRGLLSGLANLHQRASARSGTFSLEDVEPHGTRLTWQVPSPKKVESQW